MASELIDSPRPARGRAFLVAVLLLALVGTGLTLRVWNLSAADLTEDEELATGLPLLGYGDLFTAIAGRPPLAFLAQKAVIDLVGDTSAFALRLAGVLEGSLAIAVLFAFVRAVGGTRAGLTAAALLAFSAFHIEWSRDARYYPMLALMATLCLWGSWRGATTQSRFGIACFAIGFLGTALTHFSGYLFCAAIVATTPALLCLPQWRAPLIRHPRRSIGLILGALLLALPVGWLLRGYLSNVTKHLAWPDLTQPLPPLFDVSPLFLWHRLADALGVSGLPLVLLCAMMLLGMIHGTRRHLLWPLLSISVLVLPFLLFFLFPPDHPWHIKYFIYQLPILLANLALGINTLASWLGRALPQKGRAFAASVMAVTLIALVALPNLNLYHHNLAHPVVAHQQAGADLAAWSTGDDRFYCTWKERPRIIRHYCPPLANPGSLTLLNAKSPLPAPLPPSGRAPWYFLDGKSETPETLAAPLLSGAYTRVPYENFFLARSPGVQRAETDITLAPGESRTIELLCPRDSARSLLLDMDAAPGGRISARLGEGETWTVRTQDRRRVLTLGRSTLPRGPITVTLSNAGETPQRCLGIALVPHLDGENPLSIPAWDFLALSGEAGLDAVWPDARPEGIALADLRHGQSLSYRFVTTEECEVVVRLRALNDPPLANTYQVLIDNSRLQYEMLRFPNEDGTFTWESSQPVKLYKGDHTLHVGYIGMSREDYLRTTRNGRAQTMESIQNPALLEIELQPVQSK